MKGVPILCVSSSVKLFSDMNTGEGQNNRVWTFSGVCISHRNNAAGDSLVSWTQHNREIQSLSRCLSKLTSSSSSSTCTVPPSSSWDICIVHRVLKRSSTSPLDVNPLLYSHMGPFGHYLEFLQEELQRRSSANDLDIWVLSSREVPEFTAWKQLNEEVGVSLMEDSCPAECSAVFTTSWMTHGLH